MVAKIKYSIILSFIVLSGCTSIISLKKDRTKRYIKQEFLSYDYKVLKKYIIEKNKSSNFLHFSLQENEGNSEIGIYRLFVNNIISPKYFEYVIKTDSVIFLLEKDSLIDNLKQNADSNKIVNDILIHFKDYKVPLIPHEDN